MLIGIDASRATGAQPTGTEIYSRELIRALLALDRKNEYRLYTRERVAPDFFASGAIRNSQFTIRAIPFPRLWTHARLSLEMLTRAPDVLWVPAHVLPLIHPRRSFVTIHDLGQVHFPKAHPPLQRAYHNAAVWWSARAAAHLFADSESTRDDLTRFLRVPHEKISVVYPAYDAQLYQPIRDAAVIEKTRAKYRIGKDYVLTIGTIHPRKNYARLIEAFCKMQNANCELVIVGKRGWLSEEIFARAKISNLQSPISILDYVPASALPALISGARVFAFPSLYEGFGLPILEAQACGTPVVCSMTSSLPEAAGDAALFCDPLDVDAIAGALQRAWTDDALRAKLIARGFENVKRFSWEVSARQLLRAFEDSHDG
ncbi:MAG: glycosyltransferase family 4 protein [Chloroflexi bacterium]|nr:glycosyltransferase family 4 protein [Chloroflexota bacterium]